MSDEGADLLATCWTTAGDAAPQVGDERSPIALRERIEAAAANGWTGFGLVHADLVAQRERPGGLVELASMLADAGIRYLELEFLGEWWTTGERRTASDRVRGDLLDAAGRLGARTVKVAAEIAEAPAVDPERFAEELDALATQARDHGTRVALEPMPFASTVRTIGDGMRLLDTIDNPAAGLCVDIWHVRRSGTDDAEIAALPAERLFVVELDDGAARPEGTLWSDTVDRRRYPGRGAFDVPSFVRGVRATGFTGPWGVEIISAEHRSRPLSESLPELTRAVRAVLAADSS